MRSDRGNSTVDFRPTSIMTANQSRILTTFLVAVSYILTFITDVRGDTHFSVLQIGLGVLFGVFYLILSMFDAEILRPFPANTRLAFYFSILIALVFGIGWMLGPGGTWLIGIPLAVPAVERLSPRWRWPVYAGVLAAIVLPILRYSNLETALMDATVFSVGILFLVATSQVRLNEQRAREKAEQLSKQLETANRHLVEYAAQVEELAAAQERNRLAREIHDSLGHYLTIVNVQIEAARTTLAADPQRALDALGKAQELAKKGLSSVRASVAALRVSPVENRPLEAAIAGLVEETKATGLEVQMEVLGQPRFVDEKVALALYRAAQEGLTNVRKHARAAQVKVELDFSQVGRIRLAVCDDGVGATSTGGGFGLVGMRERILLLGGDLRIETQPGQGFRLEACLPDMEDGKL